MGPRSGCSTLAVYLLPKEKKRVRFPSPAPKVTVTNRKLLGNYINVHKGG